MYEEPGDVQRAHSNSVWVALVTVIVSHLLQAGYCSVLHCGLGSAWTWATVKPQSVGSGTS